jgi:16S rRNA (uracil1498-N3)-methyltransferase
VNLILLDSSELDASGSACLADARATHMRTVLRVSVGDDVRVGLIDGGRGVGTVTAIDHGAVVLRCVIEPEIPPRPRVDLLLAVPRPKVMRRLWAQLAALGVGRIILTNAERVERDYFDTHLLDEAGYRPLLIEGLQQVRDTRVPIVSVHKRFKVLIEDELDQLCPDGARLVAHPGVNTPVSVVLAGGRASTPGRDARVQGPARERDCDRVLLAVGPEGGWNDFELKLLDGRGFQPVGLGPRSLRSDTACVALLALVHDALRGHGAAGRI